MNEILLLTAGSVNPKDTALIHQVRLNLLTTAGSKANIHGVRAFALSPVAPTGNIHTVRAFALVKQ